MIVALLAVLALAVFAPAAQAQLIGPGAEHPCEPQLATAGGTAWTCPFGGLRNVVDIEGGTHAYERDGSLDRGKLRLNLSGGEALDRTSGRLVREAIALNPDLGGCTRIYDGRRLQLASFCPLGFPDGGIRFYVPPLICADVCSEMATVPPPVPRALMPAVWLERVERLERRVRRLTRRLARLKHRRR